VEDAEHTGHRGRALAASSFSWHPGSNSHSGKPLTGRSSFMPTAWEVGQCLRKQGGGSSRAAKLVLAVGVVYETGARMGCCQQG
jgi:hypothetical protein